MTYQTNKIEETARKNELRYGGCSRSVFRALQKYLNLGHGSVFVPVTPLAGGLTYMGETCGALPGGLLAIGLVTSSRDIADGAALRDSLLASRRYCEICTGRFGSTRCRDIVIARLGHSFPIEGISNPEIHEQANQGGCFSYSGQYCRRSGSVSAQFIPELNDEKKERCMTFKYLRFVIMPNGMNYSA